MKEHNQSISFEVEGVTLDRMAKQEVEEAASFVGRTMDLDEEDFARRTMRFHFQCRQQAFDDGRDYYVWRTNGKIAEMQGGNEFKQHPDCLNRRIVGSNGWPKYRLPLLPPSFY